MPASLTWIDHNPAERERMLRILAQMKQRETRDELGLGAIRDALADQLFPGTSTIQTRLRYMLFVPWVYRNMEEQGVASKDAEKVGRRLETALVKPLMNADDEGVFGRTAGDELKRLPSSVYWQGLRAWEIRLFQGSREQYHHALDSMHRQRRTARSRREDAGAHLPVAYPAWHPSLPPAPDGFPQEVNFRLTNGEAEFIRERLATAQKRSLLTFLALRCAPADAPFPWAHPQLASFPPAMRRLVEHARLLSEVMYGAAILYNLMLAEAVLAEELAAEHRAGFAAWAPALEVSRVAAWDLADLWDATTGTTHTVTREARAFVEAWVRCVSGGTDGLADRAEVRQLIRGRESSLKGLRSRFTSREARDQWRGRSGLAPMAFRWPTVSQFLKDLHSADVPDARS